MMGFSFPEKSLRRLHFISRRENKAHFPRQRTSFDVNERHHDVKFFKGHVMTT